LVYLLVYFPCAAKSISYVVWGVINQPTNKKGVGPKVGAEWQDREYLGQATIEPSVL
jgi:hypothetical protein